MSSLTTWDVIKSPLYTEKLTWLNENHNIYGFIVDRRANKIQIRQAVEEIFGVQVAAVNTLIRKGKPRRVRTSWTHEPATKRAMIKLAEGQRIE